jgi:hypothetical protein
MDQKIIDATVREVEEDFIKAHTKANRKGIAKDIITVVVELACLIIAYLMTSHLWSFLLYYFCLCFFIAFIKKGIKEYKEYRKRGV